MESSRRPSLSTLVLVLAAGLVQFSPVTALGDVPRPLGSHPVNAHETAEAVGWMLGADSDSRKVVIGVVIGCVALIGISLLIGRSSGQSAPPSPHHRLGGDITEDRRPMDDEGGMIPPPPSPSGPPALDPDEEFFQCSMETLPIDRTRVPRKVRRDESSPSHSHNQSHTPQSLYTPPPGPSGGADRSAERSGSGSWPVPPPPTPSGLPHGSPPPPPPPLPPARVTKIWIFQGRDRDGKSHVVQVHEGFFGTPGSKVIVGRGEQCQVKLENTSLSRAHAQLLLEPGGQLFIRDLGSSNGTRVNGRALVKEGLSMLGEGDMLDLGEVKLRVTLFQQ